MITRKHIERRTFLRGAGIGLGTTIALPFLDAMTPAFAASRVPGGAPVRMAFVYVPNGIDMRYWTPEAEGAAFTLPRILAPMEKHREDILMLSGLTHNTGRALGDGPGDHARAASSYLTGVHPKKTAGADIKLGISADQVAAQFIGKETRFASLELGTEDGRQVGNCDSGYSCAYSNNVSWRSETAPMPPEINPRMVFERLFGKATGESPEVRARRAKYRKSILDFVAEDTQGIQRTLGPTDRRKLDEYLYSIRTIEKQIQAAENSKEIDPNMEKPTGVPVEFAEHAKLMFDLMVVAFETDSTRVATYMLGREGSNRTYREIGVPDPHHGITHHRLDPELMEKVAKINCYHMELFAYFVERLKATKEGDGTMLDNSFIVYGSGISDGNRHLHHDLPVLVAGKGGRSFKTGRHIRYPKETPMTNLYLTMLDRVGVKPESIGDSNGKLEHLTDLG